MRQFAIKLVVFAITVAVMLGLAEGVLRLVPSLIDVAVLERFAPSLRSQIARRVGLPVRSDRLCIPSDERHDRGPDLCINRPNVKYPVRADSADLARGAAEILPLDGKGFCNLPGHAARARADIVMLGDSFTWCTAVGAEAAFTTLIETSLQAPAYNLGVAGIGPYEYLELLRRFGLPLAPKVVVMNIYEGNDLRDVLKYVKHAANPGKSKIRSDSGPFAVSYALAFLKGAIEVTVKRFRKASSSAIPFGYTVGSEGATVAMNPGNTDTDEVKHARKVLAGDVRFDVFAPPIRAFADLAADKGFVPVVTYIPSAYSAYRASVKFADETVGREVLDFSAAQRKWLAKNTGQFGVQFIDMTPAFERAAASGPLTHFPANVHLTPAGHKVVEAALAPHLKALLAGRQE